MEFRIGSDRRSMIGGDVAVIPGNVEHEGFFPEDMEVVDVFAPPREDFLARGHAILHACAVIPRTLSERDARNCNRFTGPSLAGKVYFLTMRRRVVLTPCLVLPDDSHIVTGDPYVSSSLRP